MPDENEDSEFELQLMAIIKEAENTWLSDDHVKACYLGLRAVIGDLYSKTSDKYFDMYYSRVLDRYAQLRAALDDLADDKIKKVFRQQHHREV